MKRLFTTSAILLVTAVLAVGQDWYDDDIYYDASKAKKQKMESRKDVKKNPDIVVYNEDTMTFEAPTYQVYNNDSRDVDEYNRMGGIYAKKDTAAVDTVGRPDVFQYTERIERFDNPDIIKSSSDLDLKELYYANDVNIYISSPTSYVMFDDVDLGFYNPFNSIPFRSNYEWWYYWNYYYAYPYFTYHYPSYYRWGWPYWDPWWGYSPIYAYGCYHHHDYHCAGHLPYRGYGGYSVRHTGTNGRGTYGGSRGTNGRYDNAYTNYVNRTNSGRPGRSTTTSGGSTYGKNTGTSTGRTYSGYRGGSTYSGNRGSYSGGSSSSSSGRSTSRNTGSSYNKSSSSSSNSGHRSSGSYSSGGSSRGSYNSGSRGSYSSGGGRGSFGGGGGGGRSGGRR